MFISYIRTYMYIPSLKPIITSENGPSQKGLTSAISNMQTRESVDGSQ